MTDLKALIAKQRAKNTEVVSDDVDVVLGGEKVVLTVERVHPDIWDALVLAHPPRSGSASDAELGYNGKSLTLAYPRILVDGESISGEGFAEVYGELDSTWRNAIGIVIWGININHALQELRSMGKARAGRRSPSPAN